MDDNSRGHLEGKHVRSAMRVKTLKISAAFLSFAREAHKLGCICLGRDGGGGVTVVVKLRFAVTITSCCPDVPQTLRQRLWYLVVRGRQVAMLSFSAGETSSQVFMPVTLTIQKSQYQDLDQSSYPWFRRLCRWIFVFFVRSNRYCPVNPAANHVQSYAPNRLSVGGQLHM
jgi:hypothetical protein